MNKKLHIWPAIVATIFLLVSFMDLPYGYYTFMKFVVTGVTVYYAYFIYKGLNKQDFWFWGMVAIAILFNPVIEIHLGDKNIWQVIDVVVMIYLFIFINKKYLVNLLKKIWIFIFKNKKLILIYTIIIAGFFLLWFLYNLSNTLYKQNTWDNYFDNVMDMDILEFSDGQVMLDGDFTENFCENDYLDCKNYSSQQRAQMVYDSCENSWGADDKRHKDIHNLDVDGDGIACEELPYEENFIIWDETPNKYY